MSFLHTHGAAAQRDLARRSRQASGSNHLPSNLAPAGNRPGRPLSPKPTAASIRGIRTRPAEKVCTIWVHEDKFSGDDVIIGQSLFPRGALRRGDLVQIVALKSAKLGQLGRDTDNTTRSPAPRDTNSKHRGVSSDSASFAHSGTDRSSTAAHGTDHEMVLTLSDRASGAGVSGGGFGNGRSSAASQEINRDVDHDKKYLFAVRETNSEQAMRQPNLQISLHAAIANVFGFQNRSQVLVSVVDQTMNSASHVEIAFRDQYLTRADMWRLASADLNGRTVYKGQKVLFLGSIKAVLKNIYVRGEKVKSALFTSRTKPIYRSESARFIIFIQMSKEMWEFDSEGAGEILFDRVVNGFLPDLFAKWEKAKARHLVSIVMFTRMEYEKPAFMGETDSRGDTSERVQRPESPQQTEQGRFLRDFFKVVVSNMASGEWTEILHQLKKEFKVFLRDTMIQRTSKTPTPGLASVYGDRFADAVPEFEIAGQPTSAINGNVLEAINLASSQFQQDYIDRDLVRTGISVVVVTPGVGYFEVDYNMLKQTTEALVQNGIGIDLVSLARMPLHSVPLFKYQNPLVFKPTSDITSGPATLTSSPTKITVPFGSSFSPRATTGEGKIPELSTSSSTTRSIGPIPGEWSYAVPHWIDISFWTEAEERKRARDERARGQGQSRKSTKGEFVPTVRMYELQMMGVMENEVSNISIPYMHDNPFYQTLPSLKPEPGPSLSVGLNEESGNIKDSTGDPFTWMDEYDYWIFRPAHELQEHLRQKEAKKRRDEELKTKKHAKVADRRFHDATEKNVYPTSSTVLQSEQDIPDRRMQDAVSLDEKSIHRSPGTPEKDLSAFTSGIKLTPGHISFGSRGWTSGSTKALASTGLQTAHSRLGSLSRTVSQQVVPSESTIASSSADVPCTPVQSDFSRSVDVSHPDPSPSQSITMERIPSDTASRSSSTNYSAKTPEPKHSRNRSFAPFGSIFDNAAKDRHDAEKLDLLQSLTKPPDESALPPASQLLSPENALSPWLTILNPSKPDTQGQNTSSQFGRWQHVFPHSKSASSMKWKSLCSPASLPLTTEYFPTAEQFAKEYTESPYSISQNEEDDLDESPDGSKTKRGLILELLSHRLAQGFQIVVGAAVAEASQRPMLKAIDIFDSKIILEEGAMVFMSKGNSIHQLLCVSRNEVEVKRFIRKPSMATATSLSATSKDTEDVINYKPYIRSALCEEYWPRDITFQVPPEGFNWNYVDSFLAGYVDELTDQLRYWRARFVLIPADAPPQSRREASTHHEDNEEELRIEGIRRLSHIWQRSRYISPDERQYPATVKQRNAPNPLDIIFKTGDPSVVVAAELDALPALDEPSMRKSQLFSDSEKFQRSIALTDLAKELQSDRGVKLQDRRWHLRLHYDCFIGSEMVTWLQEHFKDVSSREDAAEFGNKLMERGLFLHVESRHQFRDGNYFYQIASEYRQARAGARAGWFGTRRTDKSVPSTPIGEIKDKELTEAASTGDVSDITGSLYLTSSGKKPTVKLSQSMKIDVDPRHRSYRPEIITLHHERLHNPDNCFHIRIEWLNVTAKYIEDVVMSWAVTAEKYGLNLVEVPIAESTSLSETHPFRRPVTIKLAIPPPASMPVDLDGPSSMTAHPISRPHLLHMKILRKLDFVLDIEASKNFPTTVDVRYSWGKPDYDLTQFIHRSGAAFIQITESGDFLLLANRLYNCRLGTYQSKQLNVAPTYIEEIRKKVAQSCADIDWLVKIYEAAP
jgi:hypothetical protein